MSKEFMQSIKERRSNYVIGKDKKVSEEKITEIVTDLVKYVPSSFNSQSARVVTLFNNESDKLWDITMEALRKIVPADSFAATEEKINSFKAGYGTVLFFEDNAVVEYLQENYAIYANNFPIWSTESNGMLQFAVWTALTNEGLGGSLQHYTELIEEEVKKAWDIPASWKLKTQMPFGSVEAATSPKQFNFKAEDVKFFG